MCSARIPLNLTVFQSIPGFFSRWSALAASFLVNAFNLYSYAFGLFSDTLKDDLGFSQSDTDIIASVGELGLWSTFLVGLMLERFSPRQVYLAGSVSTAVGLGFVALATGQVLPSNPALVAMMFYMANFGTACYAQAATTIAVRNFPSADRGKVSGLIKSMFGLSSAILGVLYTGLVGTASAGKFLLLLSVGVPVVGMISSVPLNVIPLRHLPYIVECAQGVSPRMTAFYIWFTVLTFSLTAAVTAEAFSVVLPSPWTGFLLLGLVLSVSAVPMLYGRIYIRDISLGFERGNSSGHSGCDEGAKDADSVPEYINESMQEDLLEGEARPLLGSPGRGVAVHRAGIDVYNLTWRQCLQDHRFWTLYISFLCGAGSGLVVINNVAALADSMGMASSNLLVAALGLANALGRIGAGWVSDRVVSAGLPRARVYCVSLLLTCGVDLLLAAGVKDVLYPLCVAAGICYGSMFSLVLALAGDLFGAEHIGTNYGMLDLGPAAGSFVFATGVVDFFYSRQATDDTCAGPQCFRGTFVCMAIACLLASLLVHVVLVRSTFQMRVRQADP